MDSSLKRALRHLGKADPKLKPLFARHACDGAEAVAFRSDESPVELAIYVGARARSLLCVAYRQKCRDQRNHRATHKTLRSRHDDLQVGWNLAIVASDGP